jgi:hypothetical protein
MKTSPKWYVVISIFYFFVMFFCIFGNFIRPFIEDYRKTYGTAKYILEMEKGDKWMREKGLSFFAPDEWRWVRAYMLKEHFIVMAGQPIYKRRERLDGTEHELEVLVYDSGIRDVRHEFSFLKTGHLFSVRWHVGIDKLSIDNEIPTPVCKQDFFETKMKSIPLEWANSQHYLSVVEIFEYSSPFRTEEKNGKQYRLHLPKERVTWEFILTNRNKILYWHPNCGEFFFRVRFISKEGKAGQWSEPISFKAHMGSEYDNLQIDRFP